MLDQRDAGPRCKRLGSRMNSVAFRNQRRPRQSVYELDSKVNPQAQSVVKGDGAPEWLHARITNIDIGAFVIDTLIRKCNQPVLDVAFKRPANTIAKLIILGDQKRADSDACVCVQALVQLPPVLSVQAVNRRDRALVVAKGDLSTLVPNPEHELLRRTGCFIAFGVGGHEIVNHVALR